MICSATAVKAQVNPTPLLANNSTPAGAEAGGNTMERTPNPIENIPVGTHIASAQRDIVFTLLPITFRIISHRMLIAIVERVRRTVSGAPVMRYASLIAKSWQFHQTGK